MQPSFVSETKRHFSPRAHMTTAVYTHGTSGAMVASFNLLATAYTKFSTAFHSPGAPPRALESDAQKQARRRVIQQVVNDLGLDYLLTQEHDDDFHIEGFLYEAKVLGWDRTEGCRILSRETEFESTLGVDLGEGKTAVIATTIDDRTLVSLHLKGGPGSADVQRAQMARVLQCIPPDKYGYCVLGGDMNTTDPEAVFGDLMHAAGFVHIANSTPTGMSSAFDVKLVLDHFYLRASSRERADCAIVATGMEPASPWRTDVPSSGSDHVPLVLGGLNC